MAYSTQRAVSDGTLILLPLSIDYFDRTEIGVYFDGVLANPALWSWVGTTDRTIAFSPAVSNGVEVMLVRSTDLTNPRHQFTLGAQFLAGTLDDNFVQILHIAQEAKEGTLLTDVFGDLDMHGNKLINLGLATAPTDAVPFGQYQADASGASASAASAAASAAQAAAVAADATALRSDLLAPTGAGHVGTMLPFTGAVPRDLGDVLTDLGVTPQGFGADPTGVDESGPALQKWLDAMVLNPKLKYECIGTFKTSIPLVALFSPAAPVAVSWDCHIISTIPTLSDVLTFSGAPLLHFGGFLHITGVGGPTYSTRANRSALVVENCSRFSYDTIRAEYTLSHGVQLIGTTSQPNGKFIQSWYCGSSPTVASTKLATTVASVGARTGSSGSSTQTQQLSVALSLPSYVDSTAWYLRISGKLYKILTVNSPTSLQVYPWIESTIIAGDAVDFIGGAGYYSIGGDTSAGRIESLDSLVCGVGFHSLSLYPTSIDNYVSQSNGAAMVFGATTGAAMMACNVDYLYSENDVFGVVLASTAAIQLQIGPTVTFPLDRSFRLAPRLTDDSLSSSFQSLGPGFSYINDTGVVRGSAQLPRGSEGSTAFPRVEGGSVASYSYNSNSLTVQLQDPTAVNLITGLRAIDLEVFGTGANNQPTGTITITPPATHTINGGAAGAPITFTGLTRPLNLRAIWIGGTAWRVGNDIFPKAVNQVDSVAATLAALVVDFNLLLGKLRTAGLM